ncbi:MAG TPA: DUF692 domain-containing protein [Methylophilaceae bacterium]|nr:DUF692 domain-containing protein [Methylophilaceae bacterium]
MSADDLSTIPVRVGIGLRAPHIREFLDTLPDVGWVEVHSENYFGDGGQPLALLEQVRQHYPVSLHGVGLSLGSSDELNTEHLRRLKRLVDHITPGFVSDHISWSSVGGRYFNDLLPIPYTEESLNLVCRHVEQTQDYLGRRILAENASSYLQFSHSTIPEWEFVEQVANRTGCGILLDINNVYVSASNHGFDASAYLRAIPKEMVQEFHLAGYTDTGSLLLDTHGAPVFDAVWVLYGEALARFGAIPTLIEWDTDIPELAVLLDEAGKAAHMMEAERALAA